MGTHSGNYSPSSQYLRKTSRYQSIFMVKLIVVTQALKKLCNHSYRADYPLVRLRRIERPHPVPETLDKYSNINALMLFWAYFWTCSPLLHVSGIVKSSSDYNQARHDNTAYM